MYDDTDTELCEWCENTEAVGVFEIDGDIRGLCRECADGNDAEEHIYE